MTTTTAPALVPKPALAVEIERIANAEPEGLEAYHVDGTTRTLLMRRGWAINVDRNGNQVSAREWASYLHATPEGVAAAAQVLDAPISELSGTLAISLDKIACEGGEHHGWFPGHGLDERVALRFGLVTVEGRTPCQPRLWKLTDAGRQALEQWRASRRPAKPTAAQMRLLAELIEGRTVNFRELYPPATYDALTSNRWAIYGEPDGYGRRHLHITDAGREVYEAAKTRTRAPKPRTARIPVGRLRKGQVVRLANRTAYRNLGPEWVTVARVERVTTGKGGPSGYRVVVTTDSGDVDLYAGGTTFSPVVKFEIKS